MSRVVVGMSGGVDSSVVAHLLVEQGHDVVGVFMKNWDDMTSAPKYRSKMQSDCTWEQDAEDARLVCERLHIPFRIYHLEKEYYERVFAEFLHDLDLGLTPNPDILCNQEMKFNVFLHKALHDEHAEYVATGHYARIVSGALMRPKDVNKDQTYFLARMPREALARVWFPLGEYTKSEVRAIAQKQGFTNAHKKDSTGICFIGDIDYRTFIKQYFKESFGNIVDARGTILGTHTGLFQFTLGQREGLGIGGRGPYYVIAKRQNTGELVVSTNPKDPLLYQQECCVRDLYFLNAEYEQYREQEYLVQVRYRQQAQQARVILDGQGGARIRFAESQRAITPGQYAVWYLGDELIGSGKIVSDIA